MIPMTVAFFTKQSSSRAKGIANAITYAVSIIVIYTALGFAITKIFGSDALNAMATSAFQQPRRCSTASAHRLMLSVNSKVDGYHR